MRLTIGLATTRLGAGRERQGDDVDPGVGVTLHAKLGDQVETGQPLATVRYRGEARWEAQRERLSGAWSIDDDRPEIPALVVERIAS